MRLFVGLPLPESVREAVAGAARPWRDRAPHLKWVHPDLYHFTLQFLGDADSAVLREMKAALARVAARDFELQPGAPLAMPPGRRARVLALGLAAGGDELAALAAAVGEAAASAGFSREERPFRAHLTLARARRGDLLGLRLEDLGRPEVPAFRAGAFHLYESRLRPQGPEYISLADFPLQP